MASRRGTPAAAAPPQGVWSLAAVSWDPSALQAGAGDAAAAASSPLVPPPPPSSAPSRAHAAPAQAPCTFGLGGKGLLCCVAGCEASAEEATPYVRIPRAGEAFRVSRHFQERRTRCCGPHSRASSVSLRAKGNSCQCAGGPGACHLAAPHRYCQKAREARAAALHSVSDFRDSAAASIPSPSLTRSSAPAAPRWRRCAPAAARRSLRRPPAPLHTAPRPTSQRPSPVPPPQSRPPPSRSPPAPKICWAG